MRVLQTMAGGEVGGAEEFFVRLAVALQSRGVDQQLMVRSNEGRNARLSDAGIAMAELPFGSFLDRRTVPALATVIDDFRPDIVLSWMSRASAVSAKAIARSARRPKLVGRLGGYYDLKYYRGCDHLIGNTPNIVSYLQAEFWPSERGHFVPNFVSAEPGTALARSKFSIPANAPVFLAAGRLHGNKAFDVLLHALKRVDGAYLLLAGAGDDARSLNVLAHKLDVASRVRFLGWRSDIAALMATADILVCPSRIEPLGNVLIEAWARSLPIVAAASAGPMWLIRDGEDGLLVPVDDCGALAAALTRLIADPELRTLLAQKGLKRFEVEFTEDVVVRQYFELFETVLG